MNVVGSPTCKNVRLALMCAGLFYLNKNRNFKSDAIKTEWFRYQ